jgi:hypothetical protein
LLISFLCHLTCRPAMYSNSLTFSSYMYNFHLINTDQNFVTDIDTHKQIYNYTIYIYLYICVCVVVFLFQCNFHVGKKVTQMDTFLQVLHQTYMHLLVNLTCYMLRPTLSSLFHKMKNILSCENHECSHR